MELSTFLLVHAFGVVPPLVVLRETYKGAQTAGQAAEIFFNLTEIGRMGTIACVFVILMIAIDAMGRVISATGIFT